MTLNQKPRMLIFLQGPHASFLIPNASLWLSSFPALTPTAYPKN